MIAKATVNLIYVGVTQDTNGSPIMLTIEREANVNIEEQFSNYYYRNAERNMRKSKNISLANYFAIDIEDNGIIYELQYVIYDGVKYQVREVLRHKSAMLRILDLQEVTQ